jgi:hypothetical protein
MAATQTVQFLFCARRSTLRLFSELPNQVRRV